GEQALGLELLAQRLEPGQQVALAGEAYMGGAEEEGGRRLGAAAVVVGAAADHHFDAVAKPPLGEIELLQLVEPDSAGDGTLAIPQLEIGLGFAAREPGHLADQRDPRAAAHLLLQLARIATYGEGAREIHASRLSVADDADYAVRFQRWAHWRSSA